MGNVLDSLSPDVVAMAGDHHHLESARTWREDVKLDGHGCSANAYARYPVQPYGAIRRWHGELMALPAWRQTLAACALPATAA